MLQYFIHSSSQFSTISSPISQLINQSTNYWVAVSLVLFCFCWPASSRPIETNTDINEKTNQPETPPIHIISIQHASNERPSTQFGGSHFWESSLGCSQISMLEPMEILLHIPSFLPVQPHIRAKCRRSAGGRGGSKLVTSSQNYIIAS